MPASGNIQTSRVVAFRSNGVLEALTNYLITYVVTSSSRMYSSAGMDLFVCIVKYVLITFT